MSDTTSSPRTPRSQGLPPDRLASPEVLRTITSRVWNKLRRHGVPFHDREDVAQNILLAWIESLPRLNTSTGTPDQWLQGILLNHIRRYRAQRKPALGLSEEQEEEGATLADQSQQTEERFMWKQRFDVLDQLLAKIPDDHRDAVLARELDGLTFEQIAEAYGRSVSTVYRYCQAGMRELRAAFEEWKAKQPDGGELFVMPIPFESVFDVARSTREEPTAEQVERILNRVEEALRQKGWGTIAQRPRSRHPFRLNAWTSPLPIVGYLLAGQPGGDASAHVVGPSALAPAPLLSAASPNSIPRTAPPTSAVVSSPSLKVPVLVATSATPASGRSVHAASEVEAFAAEQNAFDIARAAFVQKNMLAAIKALEAHARNFPRSPHALERDQMWIEALVALGRIPEACQRAQTFRRAHPKSPLPDRAEELCAK